MKRAILIPILLSTFLLVGCSQEPTELERCIAKNIETEMSEEKYFSENEYYCSSYESYRKKSEEIGAERAEKYRSSLRFLPGESEEEWEQRIKEAEKEYEDKYWEDLKKAATEFRNSCHPELREILYSEKERKIRESKAERFCNSQGIY